MVLQHIDRDRSPRAGRSSDAKFLHLDPTRLNAFAAVAAAVERGAKTALCTGSAGAGKTTLLNGLVRDLTGRGVAVGNGGRRFECHTSTSIDDVWGLIQATGVFRDGSATGQAEIASARGSPQRHALLLDDVDQLAPEILDRVWQWWQGVTVPANALTLVLTAAKRRSNAFQPSVFEAMAAGADVAVDLSPMSRSETEIFVTHYLQAAGYPGLEVFTPAAFDQFAFYGRGTPGRIVQLAPAVLALAEQQGVKTIMSELVKQAAHEVFLPQRLKDLARAVGHSEQEAGDRGDEQRIPDLTARPVREPEADAAPKRQAEPKREPEPEPKPEPEVQIGEVAAAKEQAPPSRRASYSRIVLALTLVAFVLGVGVGVTGSFFRDRSVEMPTAAGVGAPAAVGAASSNVSPQDGPDVASEASEASAQRARAERLARAEQTVEEILRNRAATLPPATLPPTTSSELPPADMSSSAADAPTANASGSTDTSGVVAVDLAPPSDRDIEPGAPVEPDVSGKDVGIGVTDADAPPAAVFADTVDPAPVDSSPLDPSPLDPSAGEGRSGRPVAAPAGVGPSATLSAPPPEGESSAPADEPVAPAMIAAGAARNTGQADADPAAASPPEAEPAAPAPAPPPAPAPAPATPTPATDGGSSIPEAVGNRPDLVAGRGVETELGAVPLPEVDAQSGAPSVASGPAPASPPVPAPPAAAPPPEAAAAAEPEPEASSPPDVVSPPEITAVPDLERGPEVATVPVEPLDAPGRAGVELTDSSPERTALLPSDNRGTRDDATASEAGAVGAIVPDVEPSGGQRETVVAAVPPADDPVEAATSEVFVFDESVQTAQLLLNRLGYRAGRADGYFGPRTEAAIRSFEQTQGLPVYGRVTDRLIVALEQKAGVSPGTERRPALARSSAGLDPAGTADDARTESDDTLSVLQACAGQQQDWVYAESLGQYVFCRRFGLAPVR